MDFDAGPVLTGAETPGDLGLRLADKVLSVAGGEPTRAEMLGHREYFIPYKYQEKQAGAVPRCEQEC